MSPFRLSCCLAPLTLALAACQPSPAPVADTTPTASELTAASSTTGQTDLNGLIARAGIRCDSSPASVNSTDCHAGNGYAIDLHPDCADDGFFAASLGPQAVPLAAQPGAEASGQLPGNQFVCIQATARQAQNPDYYYVQAMDPAQVAACHDDATCQEYLPAADAACTAARPQGCSQGWVKADTLEVFSNGIGAALPDDRPLQALVPNWQVLDTVRSGDGHFQLQVLARPDDPQAPRSVRLQTVQADGRVYELARNDRLVPCARCGGLAGDPYAYSRFDDDGLEIVIGGGSRQRWSNHTRWRRPTHGQHWVLEWVQREVVDTQTGQQRSQKLAASALGSPHLADFDPSTLPPAPLLP
jgi:hypothetical protein